MRRLFPMLLALLLLPMTAVAARVPEVSASHKVVDMADLFTEAEESALAEAIETAAASVSQDMVVLTTNDGLGKEPEVYAEEFFEFNNYGFGADYDGVLLYINMDSRDVTVTACGRATAIYMPGVKDAMLDQIVPRLSDGQYYDAAVTFINLAQYYAASMSREEIDSSYDQINRELDAMEEGLNIPPLMALGIGAAVAAVFVGILLMVHNKSLPGKQGIRAYSGQGLKVTRAEDIFLRTHTTRTAIPKDDNHGGSGGGSGAHRSSGGRTFSSSSRKF